MCDFKAIVELKKQLDGYKPLPKETLKSWKENFITEFTYNSNAIEGNTLSLIETSIVINEGITIGGKSLREHLEAINHKEAYLYVEDLIKQNVVLSEKVIKEIHYLILNDRKEYAGTFRKVPVLITGTDFKPVQSYLIDKAMEELFYKYYNDWSNEHLIKRIAMFHLEFESIHPFIDGNGRTGRLIVNLELLKNGYLPISIKYENRTKYYEAFADYHKNNTCDTLIDIICNELHKQFSLLIELAENIR